jgi:Transcriptional regulator
MILGDALLTLARTEPVDRITVKQIVEESGLSLQTFYNHFRDKEDLIVWLHRRGCERVISKLEGDRYSFRDLTLDSIRFFAENANYLRSSLGGGIVNPYAEISAETAYTFLADFICRRGGMDELPEEIGFYLHMYVYACLYIFAEWSLKSWKLPEERLAEYLEQGMPEKLKPFLLG